MLVWLSLLGLSMLTKGWEQKTLMENELNGLVKI
jgi:hypothetical protein